MSGARTLLAIEDEHVARIHRRALALDLAQQDVLAAPLRASGEGVGEAEAEAEAEAESEGEGEGEGSRDASHLDVQQPRLAHLRFDLLEAGADAALEVVDPLGEVAEEQRRLRLLHLPAAHAIEERSTLDARRGNGKRQGRTPPRCVRMSGVRPGFCSGWSWIRPSNVRASRCLLPTSRCCTGAPPSLSSSSTVLYAAVPYSSCVDSLPIQKCTSHASLSGFTFGSLTYVFRMM
eukprot:7387686-Prymnesium_polylepis.2